MKQRVDHVRWLEKLRAGGGYRECSRKEKSWKGCQVAHTVLLACLLMRYWFLPVKRFPRILSSSTQVCQLTWTLCFCPVFRLEVRIRIYIHGSLIPSCKEHEDFSLLSHTKLLFRGQPTRFLWSWWKLNQNVLFFFYQISSYPLFYCFGSLSMRIF